MNESVELVFVWFKMIDAEKWFKGRSKSKKKNVTEICSFYCNLQAKLQQNYPSGTQEQMSAISFAGPGI